MKRVNQWNRFEFSWKNVAWLQIVKGCKENEDE